MLILTIRTDKPESEIGLFNDDNRVAYIKWEAHRQLAETIHLQLEELCKKNNFQLSDIEGIVYYQGPGSFTGLRIGVSVVNALVYSLKIPVVGAGGSDWILEGINRLNQGDNDNLVIPLYGKPINITKQKK